MTTPGTIVGEGVGRIAGFVNAYVFEEASGGTYLIDTTMSKRGTPVRKAFDRAGEKLSKVGTIILTHHHIDHVSGAARLRTFSPMATVTCHSADAPYVEGKLAPKMPALLRILFRAPPVPVQRVLSDGDMIGPFQVLLVPGHTEGEIALYHPGRRLLFSGDSVVERKGRLTLPAPNYASNLRQAIQSLSRLRKLDVDLLLPGHGVPVRGGVSQHLDDLIQRAPRDFLRE